MTAIVIQQARCSWLYSLSEVLFERCTQIEPATARPETGRAHVNNTRHQLTYEHSKTQNALMQVRRQEWRSRVPSHLPYAGRGVMYGLV